LRGWPDFSRSLKGMSQDGFSLDFSIIPESKQISIGAIYWRPLPNKAGHTGSRLKRGARVMARHVDVNDVSKLVRKAGIPRVLTSMASYIKRDYVDSSNNPGQSRQALRRP
jgi:hypothetical protein